MKKIIIICVLAFLVSSSYFIYNQLIVPNIYYSTPRESFEKSKPYNATCLEIFEDSEIALIVYKRRDNVLSDHVISKSSKGWSSLKVTYPNSASHMLSNGSVNLKKVNDKTIIFFRFVIESDTKTPAIFDSEGTLFEYGCYETNGKQIFVCGYGILPTAFPNDYTLNIGDENIVFNN